MARRLSGDRRAAYRSAPWISGQMQGSPVIEVGEGNGASGRLHPSTARLLHALPQAALVLDGARRIAAVNTRFIALAGLAANSALIGKSIAELAQQSPLFRDPGLAGLIEGVGGDATTPTTSEITAAGAALTARAAARPSGAIPREWMMA